MKLRNRALGGAPLLAGAGLLAVFQLSGPGGLTFARAGAHQEWAWLGFASLLIGGLVGARRQPIRFGGLLGVGLVCAGAPLIATAAPLWSSPLHLWGAVALAVCLVAPAWTRGRESSAPIAALLNSALAVLALGGIWTAAMDGARYRAWVWDWIEAAPLVGLGEGCWRTHRWGCQTLRGGFLGTWGVLGLTRSGLLASTHHLQPWEEVVPTLSGGGWAGLAYSTPLPPAWGVVLLTLGAFAYSPLRGGAASGSSKRSGGMGREWLPHAALALGGLSIVGVGLVGPLSSCVWWGWLGCWKRRWTWMRGLGFEQLARILLGWARPSWRRYMAQLGLSWQWGRLARSGLVVVLNYATRILVPSFRITSVFGLGVLLAIVGQMFSGFLLILYYMPDPAFTMATRETLMLEVWWYPWVYQAHVIGVDVLFILSYLHILKKIYLRNYTRGDLDGWLTGSYAFLVFHLVVFLGITLSTNHLGDVTVMIGANIFWSLLAQWHKSYAPLFSNKHLSNDQLTRFAIAHGVAAWYYLYLVQTHILFVHEMWVATAAPNTQQSANGSRGNWIWDALKREVPTAFGLYIGIALLCLLVAHPDARVVNYSFFEHWGEAEMEEINFYSVAPHWYFRAHMGLLTVCAHHYEGLAWLATFYVLLCYLPHIHRFYQDPARTALTGEGTNLRHSWWQEGAYILFLGSMLFVGGTLPCGRFYYETVDGFFGNAVLRLSYEYLYLYLGLLAHVLERGELWAVGLPAAVSEPETPGVVPTLPDAWIALFEWRERFVEAVAAVEGAACAWADRAPLFEPANYTPVQMRMQDWPLLATEPTVGSLESCQLGVEMALLLQHAWCARPYRYSPHTFVILPLPTKGEEGPAPRVTLGELLGPAPRLD